MTDAVISVSIIVVSDEDSEADSERHTPSSCFLPQDAMSGDSKVLMCVNVSPCGVHAAETLNSLTFAARCRAVELGAARRNVDLGGEVARLRARGAQLGAELRAAQAKLGSLEAWERSQRHHSMGASLRLYLEAWAAELAAERDLAEAATERAAAAVKVLDVSRK